VVVDFCRSAGSIAGCATATNFKQISHILAYSGSDPNGTANHPTPGQITPPTPPTPPTAGPIRAGFSGKLTSASSGQLSIWYVDVDWLHVGESTGGTISWNAWMAAPNMASPLRSVGQSGQLPGNGSANHRGRFLPAPRQRQPDRLRFWQHPPGQWSHFPPAGRHLGRLLRRDPDKSTGRLHISYTNVDWLRLGESVKGIVTWNAWLAAPNLYTTYNPVLPLDSTLGTAARTIVVDFCSSPHSASAAACGTGNTKLVSRNISLAAASSPASGFISPTGSSRPPRWRPEIIP